MVKETLDESRHRFATVDEDRRLERMMTEIATGGMKEDSLVVNSEFDERQWDRLAAQIAAIPEGGMIVYGWPYWED